jgi:hypothetical protein
VREILAVAGREPRPHEHVVEMDARRRDEPGLLDEILLPELVEVAHEQAGELR